MLVHIFKKDYIFPFHNKIYKVKVMNVYPLFILALMTTN